MCFTHLRKVSADDATTSGWVSSILLLSPILNLLLTEANFTGAENDYSVYVMRQASRRSWRIGQTRPVKVVFMSYRNTLQADALKLVAKKLQSSLAVEVEPEAVEVNGNGHHADGIGPTVELVLDTGQHANGNGHAPAPVNGNGHSDEATEPQQTLFSWAEFMAEEPVKPRGRKQKPQPETAALFDWALSLEQERDRELVGAGR